MDSITNNEERKSLLFEAILIGKLCFTRIPNLYLGWCFDMTLIRYR